MAGGTDADGPKLDENRKPKTRLRVKLLAFALGTLAALTVLEIALRLIRPFETRIRGDRIELPVHRSYRFKNNKTLPMLDETIAHSKNSLGFRGPEPPENVRDALSVIAVGGSTTECFYLSDGKDWPACVGRRLAEQYHSAWVNNAGLDGHSTFGHLLLLDDYLSKLQPHLIVYLVGCNDVGRTDLNGFDRQLLRDRNRGLSEWLQRNSEICNTIAQLAERWKPRRSHVGHQFIDLKALRLVEDQTEGVDATLKEHRNSGALDGFEKRLEELVRKTREIGSIPVLLTQPMLVGEGIDPATGVDLARVDTGDSRSGLLMWSVQELYNDRTRALAERERIVRIDLARRLPKNSLYFYDWVHFTNEGAEVVGALVADGLRPILESSFKKFQK